MNIQAYSGHDAKEFKARQVDADLSRVLVQGLHPRAIATPAWQVEQTIKNCETRRV